MSDKVMPANTLRQELREMLSPHVGLYALDNPPSDSLLDAILLAIKNRLPKEDDYQSPKWTVPHTAEMLVAYAEGWDKAIEDVKQALDIESEPQTEQCYRCGCSPCQCGDELEKDNLASNPQHNYGMDEADSKFKDDFKAAIKSGNSDEVRRLLLDDTNPLPESELDYTVNLILEAVEMTKLGGVEKIKTILAQEYARGKQDALNKVREQANGSYEVRTPKEPQYMVWEIAEWQLKDIEKLKEQE